MDFGEIEEFILGKIRESRLPSLSIGIIKDDELIYARGFGFRDIEKGLPATPRTIYGIGSITKSFTALAILKLVEEGKLSLEDPVDKYVPIKLNPMGIVKIHHLLTHSSGLPALGYAEAYINGALGLDSNWLPLATPEDVLAFMRNAADWAVAKPGERFFYLNEGYVILGLIIKRVSGLPYEDFVKEKILKPLGMTRTYFTAEEVLKDPEVAIPYIIDKEGRHILSRFPFGITADGGLLSNVIDMARYVSMFINRGELNGVRIVGKELIETAERGYIDVPWKIIGDEKYGYGLIISQNFHGRKFVEHSGDVGVYTADIAYLPNDRIGIIIMANAQGYSLSMIGIHVLSKLLGHDPSELRPFMLESITKKLEGVYETYGSTVRISIQRQGDYLVMRSSTKYTEETTILVPDEVRKDYARFYALINGAKVPAEFLIEGNKIVLIYERFKFIKRE
ncbi:MAG: serine hydrolase [Vulcanisaeta sp.]|jgi:CubicO group peptidase (beta-lactamase class C family)|uniref:serine hydrolase n=1 Tax=Vulcanisaeta sp. TaxID=2020871 RepID=UPI003D144414